MLLIAVCAVAAGQCVVESARELRDALASPECGSVKAKDFFLSEAAARSLFYKSASDASASHAARASAIDVRRVPHAS